MTKNTHGTRSTLIHCNACGEDYSDTYRRCPFCGDKASRQVAGQEDDYVFEGSYIFDEVEKEKAARSAGEAGKDAPKGGKRLASGSPSPAPNSRSSNNYTQPEKKSALVDFWERSGMTVPRLIFFLVTLAVIIAAFVIVIRLLVPVFSGDDPGTTDPGTSQTGDPSGGSTDDPGTSDPGTSDPGTSDPGTSDPGTSDPGTEDPGPSSTIPAGQTATSFTLSLSDFTINSKYPDPVRIKVSFEPAGSVGTVTWTSSDETVATVDSSGTVTAVGKGTAIITATLPGGFSQSCTVRSTITAPATPAPSDEPSDQPTTEPVGELTLSRVDITLNDTWPSYTFSVEDATGTVTWTTSNPDVATITPSGKVTKVGTGTVTVTATDEAGNVGTCIVRCK